MNRSVYIRFDRNSLIGNGHSIRCTALAETLVNAFSVTFVCKLAPEEFDMNSQPEGVRKMTISHEQEFFDILDENAIVVLDGYDFGPKYIEELSRYSETIVSIQDSFRFVTTNITLIINHLINAHMFSEYETLGSTRLLAGTDYALIRNEFLFQAPEKSIDNSFLIALGGTLNSDIINLISEVILTRQPNAILNVITTSANYDLIKINSNKYVNLFPHEVVTLIDRSECCFVTPGMISYEVFSRNRKVILGALNEGQSRIGLHFQASNVCTYIGYWNGFTLQLFDQIMQGSLLFSRPAGHLFDHSIRDRLLREFVTL